MLPTMPVVNTFPSFIAGYIRGIACSEINERKTEKTSYCLNSFSGLRPEISQKSCSKISHIAVRRAVVSPSDSLPASCLSSPKRAWCCLSSSCASSRCDDCEPLCCLIAIVLCSSQSVCSVRQDSRSFSAFVQAKAASSLQGCAMLA